MYLTKETLRKLRKNEQLTQEELAGKMGLKRETINKMETGRLKLSPRVQLWALEHFSAQLTALQPANNSILGEPEHPYAAGIPFYNEPLSLQLINGLYSGAEPAFRLKGGLFPGATFGALAGEEYLPADVQAGDFLVFREVGLTQVDEKTEYLVVLVNDTLLQGGFKTNPGNNNLLVYNKGNGSAPELLAKAAVHTLYKICGAIRQY